jgi:hypothetical protein
MREVLLEGELVRRGLLDRTRITAALHSGAATSFAAYGELLAKYLSLEVWIQRALTAAFAADSHSRHPQTSA